MDILLVIGKIWDFIAYTAVPFVVVLGIMIFVHELGHFMAARAFKVRVLVFKLGFGRFIWSTKRGHSEYGVGWVPIGGYVRMFGDPTEVEEKEDTDLGELTEDEKKEALYFRPAWQKLIIFAAGPVMNVALAFMIAPLAYIIGFEREVEPKGPPLVGMVAENSPAQKAGIEKGDRLLAVDGDSIESYRDLIIKEAVNPEQTLTYTVRRGGRVLEFEIKLEEASKETPVGTSGIGPPPPPAMVGQVLPGTPAERAGLKTGDTIAMAGSERVSDWEELREAVNKSKGGLLSLVVLRDGERIELSIKPEYNEDQDRYLVGITYFIETEFVRYGPGRALVEGSKDCLHWVVLTYDTLWRLVSGQLKVKTLQGPLGIGAITSQAAHSGLVAVIRFMVLISINLGILNILPFPPLDGGHILFTAMESAIGREINIKYKEWVFRTGMALLLLLMVVVTFHDFMRYKTSIGDFFMDIIKGLGLG